MKEDQVPNQLRKPGGQPGNINALKHGRYSLIVPPEELPHILSSNLDDEIRMLRSATRRVFELADQAGDIDQAIKVLGALGLASIRTSRLLKSQKELGDGDQALQVISAAINVMLEEYGWR
jgi:hypothetical protein